MRKCFIMLGKMVVFGGICLGLLGGCQDSDKKSQNISNAILADDPERGYLLNSTAYSLRIDLDEKETFKINLPPGKLLEMHLQAKKPHILHVVVLNKAGRVVSEYINGFYINEVPLDSQLADFVCSWFVEFTSNYPESGFANRFSP